MLKATGPIEKRKGYNCRRLLAARIGLSGTAALAAFSWAFRRYIRCILAVSSNVYETHYELIIRSAARNLALRARGFANTSAAVGTSGLGVSRRKRAL